MSYLLQRLAILFFFFAISNGKEQREEGGFSLPISHYFSLKTGSTLECKGIKWYDECLGYLQTQSSSLLPTLSCCSSLPSVAQNSDNIGCLCRLLRGFPGLLNACIEEFFGGSANSPSQAPFPAPRFPPLLNSQWLHEACQVEALNGSPFPSTEPAGSPVSRPSNQNKLKFALIGTVVGAVVVLGALLIVYITKRIKRMRQAQLFQSLHGEGLTGFKCLLKDKTLFSYKELKIASNKFHSSNKLGSGAFGIVYKGLLQDNTAVAIKQLIVSPLQGKEEFVNEMALVSSVLHKNLVTLRGYCVEGNHKMLVYELVENGSLDQHLFDSNSKILMDWPIRFNIIMGVARGLAYLHLGCGKRIIHRDIKASNVLLDEKLQPKIADFGLARLYDNNDLTHVSTGVAGTIGYVAPEYAMSGKLSEKADVFSFGILVMEIVAGRPNTASRLPYRRNLLDLAWRLVESSSIFDIVDSRLGGFYPCDQVMRVINVALLCTQSSPSARPIMDRTIGMLLGDIAISPTPVKPDFLSGISMESSTTEDTTPVQNTIYFSSDMSMSNTSFHKTDKSNNRHFSRQDALRGPYHFDDVC